MYHIGFLSNTWRVFALKKIQSLKISEKEIKVFVFFSLCFLLPFFVIQLSLSFSLYWFFCRDFYISILYVDHFEIFSFFNTLDTCAQQGSCQEKHQEIKLRIQPPVGICQELKKSKTTHPPKIWRVKKINYQWDSTKNSTKKTIPALKKFLRRI